ncbi:hypothetical protein ATG_15210 [Desulfurococcaceae archaeon AG1]|nr:hypothetical protein ATG_15210 [Desulfurococcaceae archaeon AG1]
MVVIEAINQDDAIEEQDHDEYIELEEYVIRFFNHMYVEIMYTDIENPRHLGVYELDPQNYRRLLLKARSIKDLDEEKNLVKEIMRTGKEFRLGTK